MGLGTLLLATILKIAFVLGVALLVFAPVLVLMERRQSAMMQDRVGPYKGGVPVPRGLIDALPKLSVGLKLAGLAFGLLTLVALVQVATGHGTDVLFTEPFFGIRHTWNGLLFVFALHAPLLLVLGAVLPALFHENRLTLFGGLHALFDAIKCAMKEDFVPPGGDKFLFGIAPIIAMVPAFAVAAVIPFGPTLHLDYLLDQLPANGTVGGTAIPLQVANLNVGILYIFAIAGTGIIGAAIAGYSSDNKFALLGGLRAASQMVSYEVTLGLALVPMFMLYDSLLLGDMVQWQVDHVWGIVANPLAFVIFQTSAIAEYKRVPFDAPEGESEIVAGYFLEYSGMKWLMYMIGEFLEVVASSMLIATIFLGGWDVPGMTRAGWAWGDYRFDLAGTNFAILSEVLNSHVVIVLVSILAFLAKVFVLCFLSITIRWTLPRFRYDQIMKVCWKILLPLSLVNIFITGLVILALS